MAGADAIKHEVDRGKCKSPNRMKRSYNDQHGEAMAIRDQGVDENRDMPEYLNRWTGLYMRQDGRIVEALPDDVDVAKGYATVSSKGPVLEGRRITIMCLKNIYHVGEEVRVIHALEVLAPGQKIFIMGPKAVSGEYVDGRAMTPEGSDEPDLYDGRVLDSPGVDYNFDITTYSFVAPGRHTIHWQIGRLRSNTLELEIVNS